jgi:four helix bundle protein
MSSQADEEPLQPMPLLDHERLKVYQMALKYDAVVIGLVRKAGKGHSALVDQALRASASIGLNIAEGVGRRGADRARCYRIAHGSLYEANAALAYLWQRGQGGLAQVELARSYCRQMAAMLSAMIRKCEPR